VELGLFFLILLVNAFDALRARAVTAGEGYVSRLRVTTRRTDTGAAIYISDNGPGMPPEVLARVFEPFFTTKPSGEGTGLGLSLAYEIVTAGHQGTLDVRSREGEGTLFAITLPERLPGAEEAAPAPAALAALAVPEVGDGSRDDAPSAEAA
jgi:signal transduction histidine kinase